VSGTTVTGTVVKDGKPVPGATLRLFQRLRQPLGRGAEGRGGVPLYFTVATDTQGTFRFEQVPPDEDYSFWGLLESFPPDGAPRPRTIRAGANGTRLDLGQVAVQPGYRLSGQVVLADGQPLPAKARVVVSRGELNDGFDSGLTVPPGDMLAAPVEADGRFSISGLPPELIFLSAQVPGYHASPRNRSYETLNNRLAGRMDRDIDGLLFLLEPGPPPRPQDRSVAEERRFHSELKPRRNSSPQGASADDITAAREAVKAAPAGQAKAQPPARGARGTPPRPEDGPREPRAVTSNPALLDARRLLTRRVQEELKLSDEQRGKVRDVIDEVQIKGRARDDGAAAEKVLQDFLTPAQRQRLRQIAYQAGTLGAAVLNRPEVGEALKMTAAQREELAKLLPQFNAAYVQLSQAADGGRRGEGGRPDREQLDKMASLRKEYEGKAEALLTDEQKKAWKDLLGEPFPLRPIRPPASQQP
jgi:hypothetical protein